MEWDIHQGVDYSNVSRGEPPQTGYIATLTCNNNDLFDVVIVNSSDSSFVGILKRITVESGPVHDYQELRVGDMVNFKMNNITRLAKSKS